MVRPICARRKGDVVKTKASSDVASRAMLLILSGALAGLYSVPFARAQSVGVNGCQFVAADCSTLVTAAQNQALSIIVTNGDVSAKCTTTLSRTSAAVDNPLFRPGKTVKCNFSTSGRVCTIKVDALQSGSCQTSCSVGVPEISDIAPSENYSVDPPVNPPLTVSPPLRDVEGLVRTENWEETIRPNGRMSLSCEGSGIPNGPEE
jgi:hypothetical protein